MFLVAEAELPRFVRPPVFQVSVHLPGAKPAHFPVRVFPFVIGRSKDTHAQVDGAGIWDRHLQFHLFRDGSLHVEVLGGALASLRGEPFETRAVRLGDRLTVGTAEIEVTLAPVRRRSLAAWEALVAVLLLGLLFLQVAAIWRLAFD